MIYIYIWLICRCLFFSSGWNYWMDFNGRKRQFWKKRDSWWDSWFHQGALLCSDLAAQNVFSQEIPKPRNTLGCSRADLIQIHLISYFEQMMTKMGSIMSSGAVNERTEATCTMWLCNSDAFESRNFSSHVPAPHMKKQKTKTQTWAEKCFWQGQKYFPVTRMTAKVTTFPFEKVEGFLCVFHKI